MYITFGAVPSNMDTRTPTPQKYTVESQYLELGYLEFCETRSVYLYQKYILIAFSNRDLALGAFLQVQITRSAY